MSGMSGMPHWLRERLKRDAGKLARARGLDRLLGESYRVLVRFDWGRQQFVFSFRTSDDLSVDGVDEGWIELR